MANRIKLVLNNVFSAFNVPESKVPFGNIELRALGYMYCQIQLGTLTQYQFYVDNFRAFIMACKRLFWNTTDQQGIAPGVWMGVLYLLFKGHLTHFEQPIPLPKFPAANKRVINCVNSKLTGTAEHPYMVEKDKETRKKLCAYAKSYMELEPENAHPDRHIAEKDAAPETTKQKSKRKKALKNPPKFTKATTVQEAFTMCVFI